MAARLTGFVPIDPSPSGSVAQSSTPEELRRRYEDWSRIFGKIAREAGLKPL